MNKRDIEAWSSSSCFNVLKYEKWTGVKSAKSFFFFFFFEFSHRERITCLAVGATSDIFYNCEQICYFFSCLQICLSRNKIWAWQMGSKVSIQNKIKALIAVPKGHATEEAVTFASALLEGIYGLWWLELMWTWLVNYAAVAQWKTIGVWRMPPTATDVLIPLPYDWVLDLPGSQTSGWMKKGGEVGGWKHQTVPAFCARRTSVLYSRHCIESHFSALDHVVGWNHSLGSIRFLRVIPHWILKQNRENCNVTQRYLPLLKMKIESLANCFSCFKSHRSCLA